MYSITTSKIELFPYLDQILTYQFDSEFSHIFLEPFSQIDLKYSKKTKKLKHIFFDHKLQASYRPRLGTFSLTLYAGQRILPLIKSPAFRIIIQDDVAEFIKNGKSVFSKHVVGYDPRLNVGDEVFIVNSQDELLAVGRMELPSFYLKTFTTGSAVNVRKGINSITLKNK